MTDAASAPNPVSPPPVTILTCGDPSGIGPELAVLAREELGTTLPFVWMGDVRHLPKGIRWREVMHPSEAVDMPLPFLPILRHDFRAPAPPGQPDPRNAQSIIDVIARAATLTRLGAAQALCTLPISKQVLIEGAGFGFPGHTEFLAHLAGVDRVVMMLASDTLRVVPVTIHIPLSQVPAALTPDLLEATIRIAHAGLIRDCGLPAPRIAVAGLNPHAGEGGHMGREEIEVMAPVIAKLRDEGLDLRGPVSADTMFHDRARAGYDLAICAYHDQALIPIKTLAFDQGVNVTLGLPYIRTSPDHGTGFDIAGKGLARVDSTVAALRMADAMARARAAHDAAVAAATAEA